MWYFNYESAKGENIKYNEKYPWVRHLSVARYRCENKNSSDYRKYGGVGIKCLLSTGEIKTLWILGNAKDLKKPSLDRIEVEKDYTFDNCQFIEHRLNCSKKRTNKINFDIAQKIREYARKGALQKSIARKYGITSQFVSQIVTNKWYKKELHLNA